MLVDAYSLRTDASGYAPRATSIQGEKDDEHYVEYQSRLLTPAERNYSTTEKEALAVVWTINKYRTYIEGTKVSANTGHQPLKWFVVSNDRHWMARLMGTFAAASKTVQTRAQQRLRQSPLQTP